MVVTRAGAITATAKTKAVSTSCKNETKRKSAARKRNGMNANQQSDEVKYG
jgi:hypothetical protein